MATSGSVGHEGGDTGVWSPATPNQVAAVSMSATLTPAPATAHSGRRHGSGRYRVRTLFRPASTVPTAAAATPPISIGRPIRVGASAATSP